MTALWALLWGILAFLTAAAIGDIFSEEVRGRLDRLPYALISLAARRLPPDVRDDLTEEWTAELHEILRGAEALPVTRLYRSTRYALGLLRVAPSIGRDLNITATTSVIPRPVTAAVVRVLVHRAIFLPASPEHYFIKVTNLSASREIEITHLWFETNPPVHVLNPDRLLPTRLRLDETFETWVPVAALPNVPNVERLGRVLLSNGKVVKSRPNRTVPPVGYVAGARSPGLRRLEVASDRLTDQVAGNSPFPADFWFGWLIDFSA